MQICFIKLHTKLVSSFEKIVSKKLKTILNKTLIKLQQATLFKLLFLEVKISSKRLVQRR